MIIKVLPLANPSIKTFQYHAFQFAITDYYDVTAHYKFSNYIQLFCDTDKFEKDKLFHLDFYPSFQEYSFFNPYLKIEKYTKSFIDYLGVDIIDIVLDAIENNKYAYLCFDEYYIPQKEDYQKTHMQHDCLINGVDSKSKLISISGYDYTDNYNTWWVSFDDFSRAFYSKKAYINDYDYFDRIFCFKFDEKYTYKFDIESVCKSLCEYLYSQNSEVNLSIFKNPSTSKKYGLSIYDFFIYYAETVSRLNMVLDIRPACLLREHKALMAQRITYLEKMDIYKRGIYVVLMISVNMFNFW